MEVFARQRMYRSRSTEYSSWIDWLIQIDVATAGVILLRSACCRNHWLRNNNTFGYSIFDGLLHIVSLIFFSNVCYNMLLKIHVASCAHVLKEINMCKPTQVGLHQTFCNFRRSIKSAWMTLDWYTKLTRTLQRRQVTDKNSDIPLCIGTNRYQKICQRQTSKTCMCWLKCHALCSIGFWSLQTIHSLLQLRQEIHVKDLP